MNKKEEKWAIFWCDLLAPIIYSEFEPEQTHQALTEISEKEVLFPNGELKRPSLSTLKRKLKKYQTGGFHALFRKSRSDRGKSRSLDDEIIEKAVELKKEQGKRSHVTINRFLKNLYDVKIPRSTLYWHLKQAGATRIKLGISKEKVRGRFTRNHTNDLWVGDFEEGPYVMQGDETVPTYLSGFIDCHSRFMVVGRYYLRQNLDVLIDSLLRALAVHGYPLQLYVDNAKVYHSHGLKMACHIMGTRLIHRPKGDPPPGGLIERIFETAQEQFETEIRAGDIPTLEGLNRGFSAWLAVSYHQEIHSETKQAPEVRYKKGLKVIRQVDIQKVVSAFMHKIKRKVNKTFSDVRLNNRFYKAAPTLRGDWVQVGFDPFSNVDTVEIYSLKGEYLGTGKRHYREPGTTPLPEIKQEKPRHNYIDLLVQEHQKSLKSQTEGIDYRKAVQNRPWPFHEFAKSLAQNLGLKGGLTAFNAGQLEILKKVYNQSTKIDQKMLKNAVANADCKSFPYIVHELKQLINTIKESN